MNRGRKKRQRYTAAEKVAVLKRHLIEREDVSAICDETKLHPTVFYEWPRRFFENVSRFSWKRTFLKYGWKALPLVCELGLLGGGS